IEVALDPVPRVEFEWLGEKPPSSRRRTLESLYRSDYSERAALDEIRETAERVWRARGHPWPRVAVWIETGDGGGAEDAAGAEASADAAVRTVVIESEPGEEFELAAARFSGVPATVEATLQGRFASQQLRSELVAGIDDADQRVVEALRALGYPRPRVAGRAFDPETLEPTVYLEPGPRRRIARVEMEGAPTGEGERLRGLIPLEPGQPVIDGDVVSAAFAVEKDLRDRGYTSAKVRLLMEPASEAADAGEVGALGDAIDIVTRFEVEAGTQQRLADIEITGAEVTRERWVERLAGVHQKRGDLVNSTRITEARRKLLETGLFGRVQVDVVTDDSGEAVLRLDLEERPRYLLAYGLRWEESEGFGALVDLYDRNAGGRGIGLGLRSLWVRDEKSLRLYSRQRPAQLGGELEALRDQAFVFFFEAF
ncbi:MAG: POTRA domain-containing protein, partial [Acidobacteriota bacterium]